MLSRNRMKLMAVAGLSAAMIAASLASTAEAQPRFRGRAPVGWHGGWHGGWGGWGWGPVAAGLIGGLALGALAQPYYARPAYAYAPGPYAYEPGYVYGGRYASYDVAPGPSAAYNIGAGPYAYVDSGPYAATGYLRAAGQCTCR
jgi:hypothetical protein